MTVIALHSEQTLAADAGRRRRLKPTDVILALQELATMLNSGVTVADAVSAQAVSAHHPKIVEAFSGMSRGLQRGQQFSATLAGSGLPLPEYVMQLARAGEMRSEEHTSELQSLMRISYAV